MGKFRTRPIPDDFPQVYQRLKTMSATMDHYGASNKTIHKWINALGMEKIVIPRIPPIPDGFAEMRANMNVHKLRKHYGVGDRVIAVWVKKLGLPPKNPPKTPLRPIPEDFTKWAPQCTVEALCDRYAAGRKTVFRWLSETGIKPRPAQKNTFRLPKMGGDIAPPKRDTPQDLAADFLRRFMPVSKCDANGIWRANGSHYRVGCVVLDGARLMEKADYYRSKYGDAW